MKGYRRECIAPKGSGAVGVSRRFRQSPAGWRVRWTVLAVDTRQVNKHLRSSGEGLSIASPLAGEADPEPTGQPVTGMGCRSGRSCWLAGARCRGLAGDRDTPSRPLSTGPTAQSCVCRSDASWWLEAERRSGARASPTGELDRTCRPRRARKRARSAPVSPPSVDTQAATTRVSHFQKHACGVRPC
eukprot:357708-Chlamydomonas_euryale.AAC.8